jgi:hypothetical protein
MGGVRQGRAVAEAGTIGDVALVFVAVEDIDVVVFHGQSSANQRKVFRVLVGTVTSVNGVSIRLTEERWGHITSQYPEMVTYQAAILDVVASPDRVLDGNNGQLIAVQSVSRQKWLLVVYREIEAQGAIVDGFIVTAFFNQRLRYLEGKKQLWP